MKQTTKQKQLGNLSLGVMAVGFAATLPFSGSAGIAFLQSGFEAGLVGGLADWFAVTALFRHPLGIPIPHTALLPKNRAKVTAALVNTVENDLLNQETIKQKIISMNLPALIVDAIEQEMHSDAAKKGMATFAKLAVEQAPLDAAAAFLEKEAKRFLQGLDIPGLLQKAADYIQRNGYEEKAFDFLLMKAGELAAKPQSRDRMGAMAMEALKKMETGGMMGFAINAFIGFMTEEKLGGIIQDFILSNLVSLSRDDNPTRIDILDMLRSELQRLGTNPSVHQAIERWKAEKLPDMNWEGHILKALEAGRSRLLTQLEDGTTAEKLILPFLDKLVLKIRTDEELYSKLDGWITGRIVKLVEDNHHRIGKLIHENLEKLDNETLIEMIEDKVGKDLQWIRVNGAICGFLIGLVIGGIQWLIQ